MSESAEQPTARPFYQELLLGLAPFVVFVVGGALLFWHAAYLDALADNEFETALRSQSDKCAAIAEQNLLLMEEKESGELRVLALKTDRTEGSWVKDTCYFLRKPADDRVAPSIVKVTPNGFYPIRQTRGWRVFSAGVRTGEAPTWFQQSLLSRGYTGPMSILGFRLDPTNPTPFSLLIVISVIVGVLCHRRLKSN